MIVCDVGPRDGLQNDAEILDPQARAELCRRLAAAGVPRIEAVSFVNPSKVPQMAGAEEVIEALHGEERSAFTGLVLNERGFERALGTDLRHVQYALPVTEAFCERNQGVTLEQAVAIGERLVSRAKQENVRISVTLAVAFGCPFEGPVKPDHVMAIAEQVASWGANELAFADTIGVGVPSQVSSLLERATVFGLPLGCHFHNTRNTGYANATAALQAGVDILDASVGGVGGCPFAPRATGNIATEDLVYLLHGMGIDTGIDLAGLLDTSGWLAERLGRDTPGQLRKAGDFALV